MVYTAVQEVVDIGTNQKPVCDFLLVSNSTISRISQCLWDIATQKSEIYVCAVLYPVSFEAFARGVPPVTM